MAADWSPHPAGPMSQESDWETVAERSGHDADLSVAPHGGANIHSCAEVACADPALSSAGCSTIACSPPGQVAK